MLLKTACVFTVITFATDLPAATGKSVESAAVTTTADDSTAAQTDNHQLPLLSDHNIDHIKALAEHQEAEYGAYSDQLSESMHALGVAQQKEGNHEQAIESLKHAMHINRVNNGIHSTTQEPALRSIIDSQQALENTLETSITYGRLLRLYTNHHGRTSPELLPLLNEISQWSRTSYLKKPSQTSINFLISSLSLINNAITITEQNPGDFKTQRISFLKGFIVNNWHLNQHVKRYQNIQIPNNRQFHEMPHSNGTSATSRRELIMQNSYLRGRDAYQKIIAIANNDNATARQHATALIELGDWFTLYGRPLSAGDSYSKAWHILNNSGDQKGLEELLGSADQLPNFNTGMRGKGPLVNATMTINKYGRAQNIKVLKIYPENDKTAATRAIRSLKRTPFRPPYVDGLPAAHEGYTINLRLKK